MNKYDGIRGGHTEASTGASGYLNELKEDRILYPMVITHLNAVGNKVIDLTPPESFSYPTELMYGINKANSAGIDFGASIHFNSASADAFGCEVWIHDSASQDTVNKATRVLRNLSTLGFYNRGIKRSPSGRQLGEITNTNMGWMIIEVCFVSSSKDFAIYKKAGYDLVSRAIANGIDERVPFGTSDQPVGNVILTSPKEEKSTVQKSKEFVGSRCKELQEKLISLGYNCGGYGADGDFGQGTYDSLIKFQKDNSLASDGLAGEKTFSKLNELISQKNFIQPLNVDSDTLRLQQILNRLLKLGIAEDGIRGNQTQNATLKLQQVLGLATDGIAGEQTWAAINAILSKPLIKAGVNGIATRYLQHRLGISNDGIFGNGTRNAVINFQSRNSLSPDGIVGNMTWQKLIG